MARKKLSRYETAVHLKSEREMAACLDASLQDGDAALVAAALGGLARAHSMSKVARDTGLTREGLYKALSGEGNPSFDTILKVATALGFEISFRRAG